MNFRSLQKRQIVRVQKLWNVTRRQALQQARVFLQTGLEYVDVLDEQVTRKESPRKKNHAPLQAKRLLKGYVEKVSRPVEKKSHAGAIQQHKQTVRHH